MTEDLILYLTLIPHFSNTLPNIEVKLNDQIIPIPALARETECKIEYETTFQLGELSKLTIEMKDKTVHDDILDANGSVILSHGIVIGAIAFGWPMSAKDKLFVEWMSDNKGSEDNTNRTDPEYQRQAEVKRQIAMSTTFTRFPLNESMIRKSCTFDAVNGAVEVSPWPNRVFKIIENGTFSFSFKPPYAYWALENFI